ncbi:type II toxin-antitoxin system death-on-curing family toxin [Nostoc sp.]|uniref:type II toxin-antitoxin system death-on-curing family toxin n=1 Tax=Nostoc sp. TaxID=1180 RepID=UPI002FFAB8E0
MCIKDSPSPEFVSQDAVLSIHSYLIERFGGSPGLRDEGLLDSALSQPQQSFFGELLHPTIYEQAAAYLYHLAKNHAFIDGNKRVALATTITFLKMNGYRLCLPKQEVETLVLEVVAGELDKQELASIFEAYILPDSSNQTTK